jgi:hypothetical protein
LKLPMDSSYILKTNFSRVATVYFLLPVVFFRTTGTLLP